MLVTVGWLASPGAVPVYDGIDMPDEPYLYVGRTPGPVAVTAAASVDAGRSASLQLKSAESGPQVIVDVGEAAFRTAADRVSLTATPVAPTGAVPRGVLDGNTYRITTDEGTRLDPSTAQGFVFLRAAVMTVPDPVIVHRATPEAAWREVRTRRAGRDVLSTPFRELGDFAVVRLPGSTPLDEAGGLSTVRVAVIVGGVVLLLVLAVVVVRRRPATDVVENPVNAGTAGDQGDQRTNQPT